MGDSLGLFLLVQPSGGKLWRMKYRVDGARGSWASEPIQK
nr:Arm DNA-binding domain-containing protein [Altericroceibacterium spongiae]